MIAETKKADEQTQQANGKSACVSINPESLEMDSVSFAVAGNMPLPTMARPHMRIKVKSSNFSTSHKNT